MTTYHSVAELRALLEDESAVALGGALSGHYAFEDRVFWLLEELQARPSLVERLLPLLSTYQQGVLAEWLGRRRLVLAEPTWQAFADLATARARARDAAFPTVSAEGLRLEQLYFCCDRGTVEGREGPRAWRLSVEARDVGPAEVIHEETWSVELWGPDLGLAIVLERSSGEADKIWEGPLADAR